MVLKMQYAFCESERNYMELKPSLLVLYLNDLTRLITACNDVCKFRFRSVM